MRGASLPASLRQHVRRVLPLLPSEVLMCGVMNHVSVASFRWRVGMLVWRRKPLKLRLKGDATA